MPTMRLPRTDAILTRIMILLSAACPALCIAFALGLYVKSRSVIARGTITDILFLAPWRPLNGEFGMFPFIIGTVWVTAIACAIALPVSILTAIYLTEYAPRRIKEISRPLLDLLAGIPSIVFGVWGVLLVVPFVRDRIAPLFGVSSSGYTVLSGGIVLAVMITPLIIHIAVEVMHTVPNELRYASLSLGATKWQTVKHVVLRSALPGIAAAVLLGLTRAVGETMAVLMVSGNIPLVPHSPLSPGYPLPALIANNYGEMMSVPLYDSALMLAAFILFVVVACFTLVSRLILRRIVAWSV